MSNLPNYESISGVPDVVERLRLLKEMQSRGAGLRAFRIKNDIEALTPLAAAEERLRAMPTPEELAAKYGIGQEDDGSVGRKRRLIASQKTGFASTQGIQPLQRRTLLGG